MSEQSVSTNSTQDTLLQLENAQQTLLSLWNQPELSTNEIKGEKQSVESKLSECERRFSHLQYEMLEATTKSILELCSWKRENAKLRN